MKTNNHNYILNNFKERGFMNQVIQRNTPRVSYCTTKTPCVCPWDGYPVLYGIIWKRKLFGLSETGW